MVGHKKSRCNRVHTDIAGREMHRQPLREVGNTSLCRRVCGNFSERSVRIHARWSKRAGTSSTYRDKEGRRDIEIEHKFYSALFQLEKVFDVRVRFGRHCLVIARCARIVSARTVNEKIHFPERFFDRLLCFYDALFIQTIAANCDGIVSDLVGDLFCSY